MREDLLAHVRFHAVPDTVLPKVASSPFLTFFMRPAPVALAMVLLVGTTAFYVHKEKTTELTMVDDASESFQDSKTSAEHSNVTPVDEMEGSETQTLNPGIATNAPVPDTETDGLMAMNTRAKSALVPESTSVDMASDEMFMASELSAGTWSIANHQTDIEKRLNGLRALIKKYDTEIEAKTKTEFTTKLETAESLKTEAEGKVELDARANLDKASVLIGEVESALSLLGEVMVEDGYIVDVKFE
jgi:hypothetical protein